MRTHNGKPPNLQFSKPFSKMLAFHEKVSQMSGSKLSVGLVVLEIALELSGEKKFKNQKGPKVVLSGEAIKVA